MTSTSEREITVTQAAAIIGCSGTRVQQIIKEGGLPHERKIYGKQVKIVLREDDVREFKRKRDEFKAAA